MSVRLGDGFTSSALMAKLCVARVAHLRLSSCTNHRVVTNRAYQAPPFQFPKGAIAQFETDGFVGLNGLLSHREAQEVSSAVAAEDMRVLDRLRHSERVGGGAAQLIDGSVYHLAHLEPASSQQWRQVDCEPVRVRSLAGIRTMVPQRSLTAHNARGSHWA